MDRAFPLITLSNKKSNTKPWITKGLINCSKQKNKLYRKYISTNNINDKKKYIAYRNTFNKILKTSENQYFQKQLKLYQNKSKDIWKIINRLTKSYKEDIKITELNCKGSI